MWILTVRSPSNTPIEYELQQGKNVIGRKPDNHIVITDESASRMHAEIFCDKNSAVLSDLDSLNGTFVNHKRINKPHILQPTDHIRIGQHIITVTFKETDLSPNLVLSLSGTRPLTRDLVLESIDQHAVFLDSVASRLTMILDLDSALLEITELTRLAVGADRSGVVQSVNFDKLDKLEIPSEITRQAIELRSVVNIHDLTTQFPQLKKEDDQNQIHSAICVPVITEQGVEAIIYAFKYDPAVRYFDRHDVQLAVAISHQAALTLQRAKLLEESRMFEKMAITDSLTEIYNRRKILQLAELEFQRARRFHHPFTLMIMDLDDLKNLNDVHGHLAGDNALKSVADCSKKQLRSIDTVGRLSGDEFLVTLIETPLEGGKTAADRIRKCIVDTPIETHDGQVNISVSIGIATQSDNTPTLNDLLNLADVALMQAKKGGKNQVALSN